MDVLDAQFRRPGRWVKASMLVLEALEHLTAQRDCQVLRVTRLATSAVSAAGRPLERDTLEDAVGATPPSF